MSRRRQKTSHRKNLSQLILRAKNIFTQTFQVVLKRIRPTPRKKTVVGAKKVKRQVHPTLVLQKRWASFRKSMVFKKPSLAFLKLPTFPKLPQFSLPKLGALPTLPKLPKVTFPKLSFSWPRLTSRRVGTLLLIVGVVLVAIPQVVKPALTSTPEVVQSTSSPIQAEVPREEGPIHIDTLLLGNKEASQPPLRIIIPKYEIDIPIVEAPVINGYWELSETTASHGIGSANPGEIGNVVVFAHARAGLFLPIRTIEKDDLVYLLTKDRWIRYRVAETKLVDPDQVEVISQTTEEKLTLFTCSGFLDSKRLIVSALPDRP